MAQIAPSTLTSVTPVAPYQASAATSDEEETLSDLNASMRMNLTSPPDKDNELIKVAALHGPPGILATLRERRAYSWFVCLGFRAIEVCLAPRDPNADPSLVEALKDCDPLEFSTRMLEMEMIDEIFMLMSQYEHLKPLQHHGLAIIELLVMDDPQWRDEVARKGGARLLCNIAKQRCDSPNILCQVMTCMSYMAAEDYIEILLCQFDALEYITHVLRNYSKNAELITRTSLALLNLTVCEAHVEELTDKEACPLVLRVLEHHAKDAHVAIIVCGVLANLSVSDEVRQLLVEEGVLDHVFAVMRTDTGNAVLQVACLKALVNYSRSPEHYNMMQELGIPTLVQEAMVKSPDDAGVQKYGDYFFGQHTSCPLM